MEFMFILQNPQGNSGKKTKSIVFFYLWWNMIILHTHKNALFGWRGDEPQNLALVEGGGAKTKPRRGGSNDSESRLRWRQWQRQRQRQRQSGEVKRLRKQTWRVDNACARYLEITRLNYLSIHRPRMLANPWTFQEVTGWVEIVRLFKCGGIFGFAKNGL